MTDDYRYNDRSRFWPSERDRLSDAERRRFAQRDFARYGDDGYRERDEGARRYSAGSGYGFDRGVGGFYGDARYSDYASRGYGVDDYNKDVRFERNDPGYGAYAQEGVGGESRTWIDKAGDEVSSWFGDRDAERRREWDHIREGDHRGRGPRGYLRSDDRIRDDVSDRLSDDSWLDASNIEVQVQNQEVTLTGTVNSRSDKRRAEDVADRVSGVTNVQNNLRLRQPSAATGVPTAGVLSRRDEIL